MDTYNVSIAADLNGNEDGIITLGRCQPATYCSSDKIKYANKTVMRADDGGTNLEYDADWENWGEVKRAASNNGHFRK